MSKQNKDTYAYSQEITQMMFVFGEVQDPMPETIHLVEDICRSQIIELVTQARTLALRRNSRSPAPEDLIFLIRYDRAKVNRLRTYLSWKDVRKNAKDSEGGGAEIELDEGAADKMTAKASKMSIKLPWELTTIYSEHLKKAGDSDDEEMDEDEVEAHEDSLRRLREADEATRRMSREEYVHYSECRQASFTFRKAKRFREWANLSAHLDVKPSDELTDTLGFLAFEIVRSLCVAGLEVKRILERGDSSSSSDPSSYSSDPPNSSPSSGDNSAKRKAEHEGAAEGAPEQKKGPGGNLFALPSTARTPLTPAHIQEAFTRMQRERANARLAGMRNFRGTAGLVRTRVGLI